jgi:hypothetical protein
MKKQVIKVKIMVSIIRTALVLLLALARVSETAAYPA